MKNALFQVDGKDYFTVGGQVNNSTTSNPSMLRRAFDVCVSIGLNTIAAPVCWEQFEPEEGIYRYDVIDTLMSEARKNGLKLIVLWFGSWKNGNSHYVPRWIKLDKSRFRLARSYDGMELRSLSPHCAESRMADARAFRALCRHVACHNTDGCVIGLQVENEPGLIGAARDYAPEASEEFYSDVPEEIARVTGKSGDWDTVFGFYAAEYFTAYTLSKYVNYVASEGKKELDLPMYVNVWLGEMYAHIPGINYPAGGAVTRMFSLWKQFAPALDAVAPDIYLSDYAEVDRLMQTYSGERNPLYIPESSPTPLSMMNSMRAVEEYGLCGIHTFGIDYLASAADPERLRQLAVSGPEGAKQAALLREILDSYRIFLNAKPLIERYQGSGRIHAVCQFEGRENQVFDFGNYIGEAEYLNRVSEPINGGNVRRMDCLHRAENYATYRAKGFVVQAEDNTFYLTGDAFKLKLYPKFRLEELTSALHAGDFLNTRTQGTLSVTEGYFDETGEYRPTVVRTGDENDYGFWVTSDVGVVRVVMDR